ncbi:MAG TPA: Nudix family hydrolase [Thiomicrorhabdus sp.]|nr:Nudix family hydrolase [Thiomicrorhabdus sp.]
MEYQEIAIGVLRRKGLVCLALRQAHQSFSDCWEFPGGKIEQGESPVEALTREMQEELGVVVSQWRPLMVIPWQYESVAVRLHVFESEQFQGEPKGCEGQTVRWVAVDKLDQRCFPKANKGIVTALQLDNQYMITGSFSDEQDALRRLERAFKQGTSLCQLRVKSLSGTAFVQLANQALSLAEQYGAKMLLNGSPALLEALPNAAGIQLASHAMFQYDSRPISANKLLGVSTHNSKEIAQALKIGADFILLSPVKRTASHPEMEGIGWAMFAERVADVPIPVFALGGMQAEDLEQAKQSGAQGVAAISGFWPH